MDNVERAQSELQEIAPPTPEIEKLNPWMM